MTVEMHMWRIDGEKPQALQSAMLPTENELHQFLRNDSSLLGTPLLVIGSEVMTRYRTWIDLLAIDADGNLHILELKRNRTPREVIAQILDYGSWVSSLSRDDIIDIAQKELQKPFEVAFEDEFGAAPPDEINGDLQLTIVASELDDSSERIVSYLRGFGVPINAVFFTYMEDDGRRYLARSWFATSEEVPVKNMAKSTSKRASWNGVDWYASFGGERSWDDALRFGFVSAGGGKFYTRTIRSLPVGARVWVNIPQKRYVGVGTVTGPAVRFKDAQVDAGEASTPLAKQTLSGNYQNNSLTPEEDEWVVPIKWIKTVPAEAAYWERGMFANQNSACKLRQEFTLDLLSKHFDIQDVN